MNKTMLFYIGLIALLLVAGFAYVYIDQKNVPNEEQKEMEGYSDFELAEYYFNADDDPEGPYDLEKARFYYEQTLNASSTEYDSAWYQLGRIDFLEGNFRNAIYKFERQIDFFGATLPQVYYMLGLTYAYKAQQTNDRADWDQGAKAFEEFLRYKVESPWARTDLAWIYFSQGRFEEMLPILEEGLRYVPESPWLLNMYGLALLNTGKTKEAQTQFERAIQYARILTEADWGRAYPGNHPASWATGLASFIDVLENNLELAGRTQ